MKKLLFLFVFTFLLVNGDAQNIISKKIKNNTIEYCVQPTDWVAYTWSIDQGNITKDSNYKIRVYSTGTSNKVTVTENPKFPNRTFNVANYGALGNGINDDTKAIQKASDALYNAGGGTLLFEPNKTYLVGSVLIKESIHYKGNGATIKRPPLQGKWTRTFRTEYEKTFKKNSKPLMISGLTFDGNLQNQGPYQNYELQQAHQIFLACGMNSKTTSETGRLKVFIEDCHFRNNVADGISQYVNVDLTVRNCDAQNVFRGGYVCTGGNSIAKIYNFTSLSGAITSGIDIEVDNHGFGNNAGVQILFDSLVVQDGDFDINVPSKSLIVVRNSSVLNPPISIYAPKATIIFENSILTFGSMNSPEGGSGAITFPYEIYFTNTTIHLKKQNESTLSAAIFLRNLVSGESLNEMNIYFTNVNFESSGFGNNEKHFPIVYYDDYSTRGRLKLHFKNTNISKKFAGKFGTITYQNGLPFKDYKIQPLTQSNNEVTNSTKLLPQKVFMPFGQLD